MISTLISSRYIHKLFRIPCVGQLKADDLKEIIQTIRQNESPLIDIVIYGS